MTLKPRLSLSFHKGGFNQGSMIIFKTWLKISNGHAQKYHTIREWKGKRMSYYLQCTTEENTLKICLEPIRPPRKESECSSIVHSFSAQNALGWMSSKMIKWKSNRIVDLRRDFAIFRGYLLCTALISFSSVFNVIVYAKNLQSRRLSNLINLVNAQSEHAYLLFSSWQFYICRYKRVSERD